MYSQWTPSAASTIWVVINTLLLCILPSAANTLSGNSEVLDACAFVHQQWHNSGQLETIISLPSSAQDSSDSTTITQHIIRFANCTIPSKMNININIPQPEQTDLTSPPPPPPPRVVVEVTNTRMYGGSILIVPSSPKPGVAEEGKEPTVLQNVQISVTDSMLKGSGDVFGVGAPSGGNFVVENVAISVQDTTLTSDKGSVMSIFAMSVNRLDLLVKGNSTLEAKFMAASVQTSRMKNSVLRLETNGCDGPVKIVAGRQDVDGHVGVLSILPMVAPGQHGAILALKDVRIVVTNTLQQPPSSADGGGCLESATVILSARANAGVAATGSVVLRHQQHAELAMMGSISIAIDVTSTPLMLLESHVVEEGSAAAVGGIAAVAFNDNGISANTTVTMEDCAFAFTSNHEGVATSTRGHLNATSSCQGNHGASTVFGIALNSMALLDATTTLTVTRSNMNFTSSSVGVVATTILSRNSGHRATSSVFGVGLSCYSTGTSHTRLILEDRSAISSTLAASSYATVVVTSEAVGDRISTTAFGLSLNSKAKATNTSNTTLIVSGRSSVQCNVLVNNSDVELSSAATGQNSAMSILGIAVHTNSGSISSSTVTIEDESSVAIGGSIAGEKSNLTVYAASTRYRLATTVLGLAVNSISSHVNNASLHAVNGSCIAISFAIARNASVSLLSTSVGGHVAASVLGIAMNSYCLTASSTLLVLANSSLSNVLQGWPTVGYERLAILSQSSGHGASSAVLGVAVNSNADASDSSATFIANGASTLGIAFSLGSSSLLDISATVLTSRFVVSAILGLAIYSTGHYSDTNVALLDGSVVAISGRIFTRTERDNGSLLRVVMTSAAVHFSCAILGVAINVFSHRSGTSMFTIANQGCLHIVLSKAGNSDLTAISSNTGSYGAFTTGGVSMCSYSHIKTDTVFTLREAANLSIASSFMKGIGDTRFQSHSTESYNSPSVLGVSMAAFGTMETTTMLSITERSSVDIVSLVGAGSGNVALTVPGRSTASYTAASVVGIALNTVSTAEGLGKCTMHVGTSARIAIRALLMTKAVMTAGVASYSSVAAIGIALKAFRSASVIKWEIEGKTLNAGDPVLQVWSGAASDRELKVASASSGASRGAIVGVVADTTNLDSLGGDPKEKLAVAFCSHDASEPSASGPGSVAVGLIPSIKNFSPRNIKWTPFSDSNSNLQMCTNNARSVESLVNINRSELAFDSCGLARHVAHDTNQPQTPTHTLPPSQTETVSRNSKTFTPAATATRSTTLMPRTTSAATESVSKSISPTTSWKTQRVETPPPSTTVAPPNANVSTPPPPKPKRTVQITTNVLLPDNEAAATVVLSTAGASGAVASTLGSSGGGAIVTAGSSVRMLECGLAEDDPKPASFEMPIQFPIGRGPTRYFAGAVFAHTLLHCVFFATPILLRRTKNKNTKAVTSLSMVFCGVHPFFTPAILGACSTVLNNDDDALSLAVAGGSAAIIITIHLVVVVAVHRGPLYGIVTRNVLGTHGRNWKWEFVTATGTTSSSNSSSDDSDKSEANDSNRTGASSASAASSAFLFSADATKDILLTFFDGCRIYEKAAHRHYASIETTLYSVIAIISGARPQANCNIAAFVVGALAAVQLLYIVVVQPYRTRLDMTFSTLNALVLVVLSVSVAVSVQQSSSSRKDGDDSVAPKVWVMKTVETSLWLISVLGFVQLAVQGYWAYYVSQRRQHHQEALTTEGDDSSDDDRASSTTSSDGSTDHSTNIHSTSNRLAEPLLHIVEMKEIQDRHRNENPLQSNV